MKVFKMNVDENQEIAMRYQIQAIPTLILFKNGQMIERILGAMPKAAIAQKLAPHLS
jgi:thioredoxin-like negative regulator of GroEL